MSRWFRWYQGTAEDGKFRLVARKSRVTVRDVLALWAILLEDASSEDHLGVCTKSLDLIESVLDLTEGQARTIIEPMQALDMVALSDEGVTLCNWGKRQFASDRDRTANDRQKRKRQRDSERESRVTDTGPPRESRHQNRAEQSRAEHITASPDVAKVKGRVAELVNSPSVTAFNRVDAWLEAGADPERDIYPAIADGLKKLNGGPLRSLKWFDGFVAQRQADRTTPMPVAQTRRSAVQNGSSRSDTLPPDERNSRVLWESRLRVATEQGKWLGSWGPMPGERGFFMSSELQAEMAAELAAIPKDLQVVG